MEILETHGSNGLPPAFLDLPPRVYADDSQWIPEDPTSVARRFSPDNPWFERGEARIFVIPDKARAAAFFRPDLQIDGAPVAFFGFWETVGDSRADTRIFERVRAWCREKGAVTLYGPVDFSTYGNYRLRVSAEPGARTFQSEAYNPTTYPEILEGMGFDIAQHYVCQIADVQTVKLIAQMRPTLVQDLQAAGYRYEPLTPTLWTSRLEELHALVDYTFSKNFAYTPLSFQEFAAQVGSKLVEKACPHGSVMIFAPDDSLAAFSLTYPHYGPIVTQSAGKDRIPVGELSYAKHAHLLEAHPPVGFIGKTVGVTPEHRKRGLLSSTANYAVARASDRYQHWYAAIIRADNPSRNYTRGAHQLERWYALYRCDL